MGKVIVIKGADFSANSVGMLETPIFTDEFKYDSSDAERQVNGILWRKWLSLSSIPQGQYKIVVSINNYKTPNRTTFYAYAVRIVDSDSAKLGTDVFVNDDSTTEERTDFTLSKTDITIGQNKWLYLNLDTAVDADAPIVRASVFQQ